MFNAKTKSVKKVTSEKKADRTQTKPASTPAQTAPAQANMKRKAAAEAAVPAKKRSDSEDSSSDTSSSDESSESDSDEGKHKKTFTPAQTAPASANIKRKAATEAAVLTKTSSDSEDSPSDASSSDESSESDSDEGEHKKMSTPAQTTPAQANKKLKVDSKVTAPTKTSSDSEDSPSDASSSEDSSSGSDGSDGEDDMASTPAQTASAQANTKRKADSEAAAPPKKAKLANGSAGVQTSGEEQTKSIFVGRLSWNVDNDWLAQEFSECGEVESAHVQMDRNTGRSRGFGYVHFKTADAVEKALAMNGREIDGRPVNIDKSSQPDKKTSTENRAKAFGDTTSPPSAVLFVGNLSFGVNEDTLWETFGEHGDVKSVRVPTDRESGRPKGFAYVEFSEVTAAKKAHGALQGYELEGRSLRLDYSQPRDSAGGRGGGQGGRGGRGRGGFGGDRGHGVFGGDRGRGAARGGRGGRGGDRGGRGGDRGGRGRGRGSRTGGITHFEGQKITFD